MKDCFGLHGHSAFGSVANEEIGVGRKSATSVGLTTDLVHWLQAGKTVDILRCAAESTDLLPSFALLRPRCGLQLPSPPALRDADYRLPPVIVLPLWFFVVVVVVVLMLGIAFNQKGGAGVVIILLFVLIYNNRKDTASLYLYVIFLLYGGMILMMIPA